MKPCVTLCASFVDDQLEARNKLNLRIENWVRAHRWYRQRGRAFSLEGQWRSPQRRHWELVPTIIGDRIDVLDAWEVELAWRGLPRLERWVLKFHYHDRLTPGRACRLMKSWIQPSISFARADEWDEYLSDAKMALDQELSARLVQKRRVPPIPVDFIIWVLCNRNSKLVFSD